uniref:Uncharacterized protein n=1 Tax=Oryza barthii TaxID=65489 RepID=A0A0D3HCD5_9ORYZ
MGAAQTRLTPVARTRPPPPSSGVEDAAADDELQRGGRGRQQAPAWSMRTRSPATSSDVDRGRGRMRLPVTRFGFSDEGPDLQWDQRSATKPTGEGPQQSWGTGGGRTGRPRGWSRRWALTAAPWMADGGAGTLGGNLTTTSLAAASSTVAPHAGLVAAATSSAVRASHHAEACRRSP